ncbi:kinase [Kitasatospora sp. MMS16-BH015]|uniref:aminoglycoside phosphotransferase family protein n=1 Tax=Kitasatospora sp. MMS16-BH015 TaxID=2018025 RepID=UPI000CA105FD|nr:aminoglycoside phosphotransferase family protein [Kitasatospora sp. MMS16-BH015]AUG77297.1 kinase [Kitasatospora sp. MMS16-BH015]
MLDEWLVRWQLTLDRVCVPGHRGGVTALVRQADGTPAVLKLGPAEHEAAALRRWNGQGAVLLLKAEPGALLLERLHADIPLRSLAEPKAVLEATSLLRHLWVEPDGEHVFPELAEHLGPLVEEARETAEELLAGQAERLLLHGALDHGHVLAADRAPWLAISPDPVIGERAYDLAWLALDRLETLIGSPGPKGAARRRITRLAEAVEVDPDRLRGWTLYRATATGLRHLGADQDRLGELYLEFASWL